MRLEGSLNLSGATDIVKRAAFEGLLIGGEEVLGVSNTQVPHEDGDLERTGAVSGDVASMRVAISYRDVAYKGQAVQQHEDLTLKHDEGRNAKYLERALNSLHGKVLEAVAGRIRRATGG